MLSKVDLFPIPLFHVRVSNWKEKKSKIENLVKQNNFTKIGPENILTDFYDAEINYNKQVEEIFEKEINELYTTIAVTGEYKVKNSWIEIGKKGMHHDIHNHGMTGISAVCFVTFNHKVHSPTQFIAPFNDFRTGHIIREEFRNVREGSLIFFPSFINHFTSPNTSEEERIILSFNVNGDLIV